MNKLTILFLFIMVVYPIIIKCQTSDNLDRINGYKSLKFNSSYETISDQYLLLPTERTKSVQDYLCWSKITRQPDSELMGFGINFSILSLSFYNGKLFKIYLQKKLTSIEYQNQLSLEKSISLRSDNTMILDKLFEIFGRKYEPYPIQDGMTLVWESSFNKLEFTGKVENSIFDNTSVLYLTVTIFNKELYNESVVSSNE